MVLPLNVDEKRANELKSARNNFETLNNSYYSGVQDHQAMVNFEEKQRRDAKSIQKYLDNLELMSWRNNPHE